LTLGWILLLFVAFESLDACILLLVQDSNVLHQYLHVYIQLILHDVCCIVVYRKQKGK